MCCEKWWWLRWLSWLSLCASVEGQRWEEKSTPAAVGEQALEEGADEKAEEGEELGATT